MHDFLNMGGYAAYVWPAYGLALFILIYNVIVPLRRERSLLSALARRLRRDRRKP